MPLIRTWLRSRRAVQRDIGALIARLRSESKNGVHLGSGADIIAGLINCDAFHPKADLKISATDLSHFGDGSVDYIETHHMIEHLSFEESDRAFRELSRVLQDGGHLVITCPDFTRIARRWMRQSGEERWSDTIKMIYGSQEHEGMFHKSGYDAARLRSILTNCGFEVLLTYTPYPRRPTPSLLAISRRIGRRSVLGDRSGSRNNSSSCLRVS